MTTANLQLRGSFSTMKQLGVLHREESVMTTSISLEKAGKEKTTDPEHLKVETGLVKTFLMVGKYRYQRRRRNTKPT
jgi:hypothetical protein